MIFLFVNESAGPNTALENNRKLIAQVRHEIKEAGEECIIRATRSETDIDVLAVEAWRFAVLSGYPELKIILASGDTTIHQLVNALLVHASGEEVTKHKLAINLALVPLGTANALATALGFGGESPSDDVKLTSVRTLLKKAIPIKLSLFTCKVFGRDNEISTFYGTVVASGALHAHLLKEAETMRSEYPGPERFTRAAERITSSGLHPYDFDVELDRDTAVQQWNTRTSKWERSEERSIKGPFGYFIASTCPELEPNFCIAPQANPALGMLDLVMLGLPPPAASSIDESQLPKYIMQIFGAAWDEGKHLGMTWPDTEVEAITYLRVSSFILRPKEQLKEDTHPNHLFCVDGNIVEIPVGGRVEVAVDKHDLPLPFAIYV